MMTRNIRRFEHRQRGMVLVTALLMLIVVTLLAISMFRSFGIDEKIAGNVREKTRALTAAETAEQYAEYWLSNNAVAPITCTAGTTTAVGGQVCSNAPGSATGIADVTVVPWTLASGASAATTYLYAPTASTTMNLSTSGGAGTFYGAPGFYISFLGASTSGNGNVYQIDAFGYGGSPDTVAVIETTYSITSSGGCTTCGQ